MQAIQSGSSTSHILLCFSQKIFFLVFPTCSLCPPKFSSFHHHIKYLRSCFDSSVSLKTAKIGLIFGRVTEMQRLATVLLCWDVLWTDRAEPRCLQWEQNMWNEYWCFVVYIISRYMKSGHLGKSFAKRKLPNLSWNICHLTSPQLLAADDCCWWLPLTATNCCWLLLIAADCC